MCLNKLALSVLRLYEKELQKATQPKGLAGLLDKYKS